MIFSLAILTGTQVAKGHASKCFQPFLLPKDLKGRPEELKNKLLVDFDPSRCFIRDLEASTVKKWFDVEHNDFSLCGICQYPLCWFKYPRLSLVGRVLHHIPGMAWFSGRWRYWPNMGEIVFFQGIKIVFLLVILCEVYYVFFLYKSWQMDLMITVFSFSFFQRSRSKRK